MKKQFLLYILIIFLCVVLLAFFKQTNEIKPQKNIVFWTLQLGTFDKYINKIINDFEKEHPQYKIKWIDVPYSEGEKRTLAAILTDNPPDLVNLTPDFSLLLAQKNALHIIDKEKLKQYLPSITESLKYNNEYFGIPFYATSAITLYNKNLTDKKISTYDDLFEFIPEKNSYTTMINIAENDTLLKLLNKYGINSPQNINSEKSVEIYKKLKKLYDTNKIPKESVTQTHRDSLEKYMSGQIAYLVTGANFLNMIKENAPTVYSATGILPQLIGDTNLYDYSLMNFVVPKKAKNTDGAIDFALYFTNKTNQLEFAKLTTILPTNKEALNDTYFKSTNTNDIQEKARIISSNQLNNLQKPIPNIKNKKELNTLSANYVQEILIKNKNIKETLDKFAKDWQNL